MSEEASLNPPVQPPAPPGRVSTQAVREPETRDGTIAVRRILTAVRRHLLLIAIVTTFTTTFALIVSRQPAYYRAEAVLRLVGERRAVAPDLELSENLDERHVVLVNSLVPRLRSRAVIGTVVDHLGLQVRPLPMFSLVSPPGLPDLPLANIHVAPGATPDTVTLLFAPDYLTVRHADSAWRETYGKPIAVGSATFTVRKAPEASGAVLAIDARDVAIDRVLDQLAVLPLTGTDALDVRYLDTDPDRAMNITNGVVRTFYVATINSSQDMARRRRIFLEAQLQESDRQLARAEGGLSGFRSRRRLSSSSDKLARQQSDLLTLDARRGELQADRRVFASLLARLQSADDSSAREQLDALAYSPEIATDPVVGKVFQLMLSYRTRLDSLTSGPYRSSPTNPDLLQLRQMVGASGRELVRAAHGRVASIDERLAALEDLRSGNADEIAMLPALAAEEARLQQKVSALADFSNQLRLEYQKARMAEALAATDIEIVDYATRPYLPTGVPWWLKVGLALVFGLVVGTVLAMLLELKNHSIRAPEELEEALHVRGLGVIPPVMEAFAAEEALALGRASDKGGLGARPALRGLVSDSPVCPSVGAEAFRLLYSSLTFGWGNRRRTILVTSVAPQEGKTLVAANLAVTFAREGARVLLVDCDLRRPRLHKMFQVSRAPGLVELLRPMELSVEAAELDVDVPQPLEHAYSMFPVISRDGEPTNGTGGTAAESAGNGRGRKYVASAPAGPERSPHHPHVRETSYRGLFLLPCGTVEGSVAETLKAGTFRALLAELSDDFDVIMLDTPPTLVSADAVILAPVADDVLLVVQAGRTDRHAAERAQQQLTQAGGNVIGAVLNDPEGKVPHASMNYYSYGNPATSD